MLSKEETSGAFRRYLCDMKEIPKQVADKIKNYQKRKEKVKFEKKSKNNNNKRIVSTAVNNNKNGNTQL